MTTRAVKDRAGTVLNHRFTKTVRLDGHTLGKMDESQGLYQFGGKRTTFVLWKMRLLGLGLGEWKLILAEGTEVIEFIESEKNECWRISVDDAQSYGQVYNVGYGEKFGIPIERFGVFDANGAQIR